MTFVCAVDANADVADSTSTVLENAPCELTNASTGITQKLFIHGLIDFASSKMLMRVKVNWRERIANSQMDVYDSLRLVEKPTLSQRIMKFLMKIGLVR